MSRRAWGNAAALAAVAIGLALIVAKNASFGFAAGGSDDRQQLVNVSYDPTRELYQALNPLFTAAYERQTGRHWTIVQSHGGSSQQARRVITGEQSADVVTLGLPSDIEGLHRHGLVAADWADRLPNQSRPYTSTIVFVVRHGNPHGVRDWPDLLAPGLDVVVPDPRTSGNGRLAALAAWAAITKRGGAEDQARAYLRELYRHVPALDEGARGAAIRFAIQEAGDVHLTWENEALREVEAARGKLDIVYPPVSILAEPCVTWVDTAIAGNAHRAAAARAYLEFLFSDAAQEVIARFGYRPFKASAARPAGVELPRITLVPITAIARDWSDASERFFGEDGVITTIIGARPR